jgi:hypothetical protein
MSLAIRNGRSSAIHVGLPWRGLLPEGDGALSNLDRRQTSGFYAALLLVKMTSTANLQLPVDCVLAGQQREFKPGRAHLAALRGIFRE